MQLWEYEAVTEADPDDLIIISRDGVQYYSVSVKDSGLKDGLKYWTETETEIYQNGQPIPGGGIGGVWISGTNYPKHLGAQFLDRYYEKSDLVEYAAHPAVDYPNDQPPENLYTVELLDKESPTNMTREKAFPIHTATICSVLDMGWDQGSINTELDHPDFWTKIEIPFSKTFAHIYTCRGSLKSFVTNIDGDADGKGYHPFIYITDSYVYSPWHLAKWVDLDYIFFISCVGAHWVNHPAYEPIGSDRTPWYSGYDNPDRTLYKTRASAHIMGKYFYGPEELGHDYGIHAKRFNFLGLPPALQVYYIYDDALWCGVMLPAWGPYPDVNKYPSPPYTGKPLEYYKDIYIQTENLEREPIDLREQIPNFGPLEDSLGNKLVHPAFNSESEIRKLVVEQDISNLQQVFMGRAFYPKDGKLVDYIVSNAQKLFKTITHDYLHLHAYFLGSGDGSGEKPRVFTKISVNEKKAISTGLSYSAGDVAIQNETVYIDPLTGRSVFKSLNEKHGMSETSISDILQVKLKPSDGIHISDDNVISATFGDDVDEILQEKILSGGSVGVTYDDGAFIFSKDHVLNGYVTSLQNKVPVYSVRSTDDQTGTITDALYFNLSDLKEKVELPIVSEGAGIDISVTDNVNKINSYGVTQVSVNGLMQTKVTENNQNYIDIDSSYFNPNTRRSRSAVNTKYISGYPVEYIKKEHGYFSKDVDLSDLYNRVAALEEAVINQGGE